MANNKIILLGEPKTTNNVWRNSCRGGFSVVYMSPVGKTIKDSYIAQTRSQWQNKPIIGDVELDVKIYFGTKRKCDIDNFHKLSFDAMSGIVYEDDSQIKKMTVEKFYDKENPRIEITVL